jgi:putative tRNA adenosine deaminase-associated protein
VSYFAAAAVRGSTGWSATEVDLGGVADIEEVADRLRDVAAEAPVALLFVESDDAYLTILRLDDGEDLRIFGSDGAFAEESRLGALLLGDIQTPVPELDEVIAGVGEDAEDADDDLEDLAKPPADPDIEPVGDADLLADLGIPAPRLLALCAREGLLPADVTAEVCLAIGAGDSVEEIREA